MAGVRAVVSEPTHRVLEGTGEQRAFVKALGPGGTLQRSRSPGQQGEVAEPDRPLLEGGDTCRQLIRCLAGRHRAGGSTPRHPALVANPVDRRVRTLRDGLVGGGERGGLAGEAQLQQIDGVTEPDQALAELEGRDLYRRSGYEALDERCEPLERVLLVAAITHRRSIHKEV